MSENPYQSPRSNPESPPRASPPTWMLRTYQRSRHVALFGAGGSILFAMLLLPPCGCGFAMMPSWQAWTILLGWLAIVLLVSVSAGVVLSLGTVLWLKYNARCPGMILALVGLLLVFGLSLPLFG
jgi:hypothetical protein